MGLTEVTTDTTNSN